MLQDLIENEQDLKKAYRKFSMIWHPDRCLNKALSEHIIHDTFSHIKLLYEVALKQIQLGVWKTANTLKLTSVENNQYTMTYLKEESFDLGKQYIGQSFVAWVFDKENEDLANNATKQMIFTYANDKMKEQISASLPIIKKAFKTTDKTVIVVEKEKSLICLRDVLNFYKGKIDPKHVAWILSGLYNTACYLEFHKKMHGGISIDNYFINPDTHQGALLGGWWYAHNHSDKLTALGLAAMSVAPPSIINEKKANTILNLEMIKAIGRELLGDKTGIYLPKDKTIPSPLVNWLRDSSGSKTAYKEYETWQKEILTQSFGVRRFTKMELTSSDIYQ
jgi:serine/threonine protein kinase